MKKSFYLGAILASTCLLSGCSKVLVCERSNDYNEEMKMNQTIKVTFKKNTITNLTMDMNINLSNDYLEYKDELISSVEDEFANLKDTKGIAYSTKDNSNGFTFNLNADIANLDEDTKNELDLVNTTHSYKEAKEEFENEGYTCK